MEAGFEASKALPLFIHLRVARIIDSAEVENGATILFGDLEGSVGEEGGGVECVANFGNKSGVVGGDTCVIEDEKCPNKCFFTVR